MALRDHDEKEDGRRPISLPFSKSIMCTYGHYIYYRLAHEATRWRSWCLKKYMGYSLYHRRTNITHSAQIGDDCGSWDIMIYERRIFRLFVRKRNRTIRYVVATSCINLIASDLLRWLRWPWGFRLEMFLHVGRVLSLEIIIWTVSTYLRKVLCCR